MSPELGTQPASPDTTAADAETKDKAVLWMRTGRLEKAAALKHMLKELNPLPELVWIEPRPGLANGNEGPVKDVGVRTDFPDLESLPKIAELRLCWPEATLHYVADDDDGFRWAAFAVEETKLPVAEGLPEKLNKLTEEAPAPTIVWRRDYKERFHDGAAARVGVNARIRAFRKDDRLVTWWLVKDSAAPPRAADPPHQQETVQEHGEGAQP